MNINSINSSFLKNQNLTNIRNNVIEILQDFKKSLSHTDKLTLETLVKTLSKYIELINNNGNLSLPSIIENFEKIIKINYKLNCMLFNRKVGLLNFYSTNIIKLSYYLNILSTIMPPYGSILYNQKGSMLRQFMNLDQNRNKDIDLSDTTPPKSFIIYFNNTYIKLSDISEDNTTFKKHIPLISKYTDIDFINYITRSKNKISQQYHLNFQPIEERLNYENLLSKGYCNGLERVSTFLSKKELYSLHQKFNNNQLSLADDFRNLLDKKLSLPIEIIFIGIVTLLHRILAFKNSKCINNIKEIKNILIELENIGATGKITSIIVPKIFAIPELIRYIKFDKNGLYGLTLEAYQLGQEIEVFYYKPIFSIQFFDQLIKQLELCTSKLYKNGNSQEIIKFAIKRLNSKTSHAINLKIKYNKLQNKPIFTIELFDSDQPNGAFIFKINNFTNDTLTVLGAKILTTLKQNEYNEISIYPSQLMPNFTIYKLEILKVFHDLYNTKTAPAFLHDHSNTTLYLGKIKKGQLHDKQGKYIDSQGNYYRGEFNYGKITGNGVYTWQDGSIYTGNFVNSHITGKGRMSYKSKDGNIEYIYEGDFIDEKMTGKGRMVIKNTFVCQGEFINGKLITGTISWTNGNTYFHRYICQ